MRDGHPFPFELIAQFERIAKLLLQVFHVRRAHFIHRCIFLRHLMSFPLEQCEIDLPQDGRVGVIHLLEEDIAAHGFVFFLGQQFIGEHHFAESGGRLSQRQGRMECERAVMCRKHGMDGMSEFVRHGCHVPRPALIIQQNVWRHIRHDRPAERAVAFASADFAIHMLLIEDALRHFRDLRVEGMEGIEYHFRCRIILELFIRICDRGVNIITT